MKILVSNDDGVDAHGIQVLAEALDGMAEVWVVAPTQECSAQSHALTLHQPLRVETRGPRRFAVSGTPADCVYIALHELLPFRPDLVVSGINHGSNLSNDVLYSGTVAAAMEGVLQGVPSVAFSLHFDRRVEQHHFETAARVARRVVARLFETALPPGTCLNVNVPDIPHDQLRGLRACVLGERRYHSQVDARVDPRGRKYFWLGGAHKEFGEVHDSDGPAIEQGYATLTPLHADLTFHGAFGAVRELVGDS